jgi:alkanesulfonate monooxygenase SsuD/methylene tetrahydromethanopterin reductase-like flavin-dependent oxidoreductase (luciferase family)
MQLGFFTMPIHPLGKDWRQCLREDREAVILADALGFAEAYVGHHTSDLAENITSCVAFLATLVDATRRIRLGTGTVNLPNSHPAAVAAEIAMLDHLLDGRFNFGISPGGLLSDAELFGNLDADRGAMFREAIDMILALWAGEPPYRLTGRFWTVMLERQVVPEIGQGFLPKPLQRPHPPILVTAASPFSGTATEAGRRGWAMISANFLMPVWVASHWQRYVEGCARAGRKADPHSWRVAKSIFVADDMATARAYATDPDGPYRYYYKQLYTKLKRAGRLGQFKLRRDQPDEEVTLDGICERLILYGTPDKIVDDLLALRAEVGSFGTLLYAGKDWKDRDLARRSMVLMAEKVLPALNAALAGEVPQASPVPP